jgi:hypothetical protein
MGAARGALGVRRVSTPACPPHRRTCPPPRPPARPPTALRREFPCDARLSDSTAKLLSGLLGGAPGGAAGFVSALTGPAPPGGGPASCRVRADALLAYFGFARGFGASMGALVAYLGVLHALSFLAMARLARWRA